MDVDVIATVVTGDLATAPFSGNRAAVVVVEALKTDGGSGGTTLGATVFGDLLRLRWETGELEFVARRATFTFTSMFDVPPAPEQVPAELVPMLQRGATAFRERLIQSGDRLRLRARVERYSASDVARFVVRDELGVIRLDEVLSFSSSSSL